jgi:hypothetical protein
MVKGEGMTKITHDDFCLMKNLAETFMADGSKWADGKPKACSMVVTGSQAWGIAHRSGITEFCYGNTAKDYPGIEGICDAHIVTALKKIFPNAVFKDSYRY